MTTRLRPKIPARKSPYASSLVGGVSFTAAAESGNARAVAVQLKDQNGQDLAVRGRVRFYLTKDANGDTLAGGIFAPSGGVLGGADGLVLPGALQANSLHGTAGLAVHSTPEQFKTTATVGYFVYGVACSKSAATGLTFTAAHVVAASKFGVVLVQVNAAGTISTKVPAATQSYDTAAAALAALPEPDSDKVALGYIAIANNAGAWTANTDDLTDGSDLTTATFVDAPANGPYPVQFDAVSEADGDIDLTVTETRVRTSSALPLYLACLLPDGSVVVSSALTFA